METQSGLTAGVMKAQTATQGRGECTECGADTRAWAEREGQPSGPLHPRLAAVIDMVPSLAATIGRASEVVVHDLSKVPNSIVAIAGNLTGRAVGGPMTDLLISAVSKGTTADLINYHTETADGRLMRSSTIFVRDADGVAIGCLCINIDVTSWADLADIAAWNLGTGSIPGTHGDTAEVPADLGPRGNRPEAFPSDMGELREALVAKAIEGVGVPVDLMQKQHKKRVVQALDADGFFLIKGSVSYLARALHVTRYSIYNYLNEIRGTERAGTAPGTVADAEPAAGTAED
jgi:predicted transcriptional regulator YheO